MENQLLEKHLCQCGCGKETSIITINDKRLGLSKGAYRRFVQGHQRGSVKHRSHRKSISVLESFDNSRRDQQAVSRQIESLTGKAANYSPFIPNRAVWFNPKYKRWYACCKDPISGKWRQTTHARLVYLYVNGSIPEGYEVHHKNGSCVNIQDDRPDNLIAIPKAWNGRFITALSRGFLVSEKHVTDVYISLVNSVPSKDLFREVCRRLLEEA